MAEQVTFEEWFDKHGKGLNGEARRLMQMSWNAAKSTAFRPKYRRPVDELAREALSAVLDTDETLSKDWHVSGYGVASRTSKSYINDKKVRQFLLKASEDRN